MSMFKEPSARLASVLGLALAVFGPALALAGPRSRSDPAPDPFTRFTLPEDWQARFWASPNAIELLKLDPKQVADLAPTRAGLKFCRCPACDAEEADDPLEWSLESPKGLTCKRCKATFPNDKYPATDDKKKVPEEVIEVLPGVSHHYPYHEVEASRQRLAGERLYLAAKADDQARSFLAKAALYAAVKASNPRSGTDGPSLARLAAVIVLRFAQVYPSYATRVDQPGTAKFFQQADLAPPYRLGYRTAKWDWSGSLDVPLNLVIAHALIRDRPELDEAGALLGDPNPRRTIEENLFRASARFVANQPEEFHEGALLATRGILAVGRLLNDPEMVRDGLARLDRLRTRGFTYDGFWGGGSLSEHLRVIDLLDGWVARLVQGEGGSAGLALAREAGAVALRDSPSPDVLQASWPAPSREGPARFPRLLGGAGIARLAVGQGADALDLELRSLDAFGPDRIQRQALRLGTGGRVVLGDLDEQQGLANGWDRSTLSHNTVIVDGRNQRESLAEAQGHSPSGNFWFFAADPDFQVVTLDDPLAYPTSTTRYRQTLIASAGKKVRYALSVFEVVGGGRHDQAFHGASGTSARWSSPALTSPGPSSLLPSGVTRVDSAHASDGRWFVQAFGDLLPDARGPIRQPTTASLDVGGHGVRLHLLGDLPASVIRAASPDTEGQKRGTLLLRREAPQGSRLATRFVTLFEPTGVGFVPLKRVGRIASADGTVVVVVETEEGVDHLIVNSNPGTAVTVTLLDGRSLTTDGLAVRVGPTGLTLAGGSFAECDGRRVSQAVSGGTIRGSFRQAGDHARGGFDSDTTIADPESLNGRVLVIRHGDGVCRAWTLTGVENRPEGARLLVREDPGFSLEQPNAPARYLTSPGDTHPGPHTFRIGRITR